MANTYLTRTFGSSPSTTKFTWSAWVKRSKLGVQQAMISGYQSSNTGQLIYFTNDDKFAYYAQASGTVKCNLICNAQLRDTNAWYHLVLVVDSSQASASDRVKFYVNNVEQSYTTTVAHVQNWDAYFMLTVPTNVGRNGMNTSDYFDGVMSHMHMTHGYNYTPSTFGSVDATTGEWKINTSPTVNYNSNGFFILKDGNTGTDHSGNSETFSSGGGTLTKTEDCPSNVFATLNPLNLQTGTKPILQYGNTSVSGASDGGTEFNGSSTLGMSTGKFYMEFKSTVSSNVHTMIGITSNPSEDARSDHWMGTQSYSYGYYANDGKYYNGNTAYTYGNTYTSDIIGVALDLDNNKLYFSKNGTWQNSGVPTSGSTGTGAISITDNEYFFGVSDASGTYISSGDCNFGNGYFGTTAVSSAGTNASGIGIFEYDVPTGFTALSTKGLNL